MSTNEVIDYENFLNRHSGGKRWKYIDWPSVKSMFNQKGKDPVCLFAFKSEHGAGIDPYYGLPYEKYIYFIQDDKPRYELADFMNNTGQSLLDVLEEKYGIYASEVVPQYSYTKKLFKMEAVPRPPVIEGHFEISFGCTLKAAEGSKLEIEASEEGIKAKAHAVYENIVAGFNLDLNTCNGNILDLGLKSSVLIGSNGNGEFSSKLTTPISLPGGIIQIKSEGTYTRTERRFINGGEWDVEYSLSYEAEAKVKRDNIRRNYHTERITVPVTAPGNSLANRYADINSKVDVIHNTNWLERNKDSLIAGGKIAGGILLVGFAVVLAVGTDGIAAPLSAVMARRGTIVAANAFYAAPTLAH